MPTPVDDVARVVLLLHRDVRHEAVLGGAVPVVLSRLEEDPVTGPDDLDRTALTLAQSDALGHEDRLAVRVGVPSGPGSRGEMHQCRREARAAAGRGDGIHVDVAGEPVGRALVGRDARAGELHGPYLSVAGVVRSAK